MNPEEREAFRLKGKKLNAAELENLCSKIEKLRIAGATYDDAARALEIPPQTLLKHYKAYTKRKLQYTREHWEEEIRECLERQRDIIRRARETKQLKVEEKANQNYLSMLQTLGIAPSAPEKIEHSGSVEIVTAKKIIEEVEKEANE